MSLFGESPPASPSIASRAQSKSLFGEASIPSGNTSTSLFADDAPDSSPWSMPTPKKNARQNLVKNLLPATQVPESYIDAYDLILNSGEVTGSGLSLTAVQKVLQSSGLSAGDQERIQGLVVTGGQVSVNGLGRSEFNVLLALVGLGQEGDDITLDGVDERRKRLPQPNIAYLKKLQSPDLPKTSAPETPRSPQKPRQEKKERKESFGADLTADPWASPATSNIPPSAAVHTMKPTSDEFVAAPTNGMPRTTSSFTTSVIGQETTIGVPVSQTQSSGSAAGSGWGSYNGSTGDGFSETTGLGGGFGDSGDGGPNRPGQNPQRSISTTLTLPQGTGELVTITILPEKEGLFLFQHHNYEVKTIRRGSSVVRRYSDFVWLLDCLQKRYSFRRLPLLPPKRVQVNGNHLSADGTTFLERRRRGLVRFSNALVQHPVLSQETLVIMFLTVPTELSVWRKQATISVQEEFVGKALPPNLEDSLPSTLSELFDQVRIGVTQSASTYINLCVLLERLVRRNEGLAADNLRFSVALQTLAENSKDTYAIDTNDVPLLNEGINATGKHLASAQTLLDDEARAWDSGILEDFKRIRDAMVSMKDMFDRRDKLARNNIPQLERRIEASENKLHQLRNKPQGLVKPGEMEKVESSIMSDKENIVQQHARGVFIKECIRDEIVTFQTTIFMVSRLYQDWAQERVKYAELQASNWRTLVEDIESMPIGE